MVPPTEDPVNPYQASKFFADDPRQIVWENQDNLIRSSQVIVVALASGLGMFAIVLLTQGGPIFNAPIGRLSWIGIAMVAGMIPFSFLLPNVLSSVGKTGFPAHSTDSERYQKFYQRYQVQLIIGCAMLEGAGFLNLIAYQNERNPSSIGLAGVCVLLILARMPTRSKVQNWIARQ